MSLYPSLEDMKVDRLYQAQFQAENGGSDSIAPGIPAELLEGHSTLPYPVTPSAPLYPSLANYMGLELTEATLAANMPEYLPQGQNEVGLRPDLSVAPTSRSMFIAPLSGNDKGLQRAHVTNGIREMVMCKDGNGRIGIKLQAVNNGIFVALVKADSSAAKAGLRFGDQILQIRGKDVAGMSAEAAHDLIKKGSDTEISIIARDRPLERTVTLHKDSSGRVGFTFKNGKIMSLVVDSSAARNGLLTDHQILEINGQNVIGLKDKEITQIVSNCGNIVTVTVIPSFLYEHMTKRMASSLFGSMDHSIW